MPFILISHWQGKLHSSEVMHKGVEAEHELEQGNENLEPYLAKHPEGIEYVFILFLIESF